jgi:hypothetical protein
VGPLNILIAVLNQRSREKRIAAKPQDNGEAMKPINIWPMLMLLIVVVLLIAWLGGYFR